MFVTEKEVHKKILPSLKLSVFFIYLSIYRFLEEIAFDEDANCSL